MMTESSQRLMGWAAVAGGVPSERRLWAGKAPKYRCIWKGIIPGIRDSNLPFLFAAQGDDNLRAGLSRRSSASAAEIGRGCSIMSSSCCGQQSTMLSVVLSSAAVTLRSEWHSSLQSSTKSFGATVGGSFS
jgi:hypothetical protein